jgi:CIC family chloride channel protein
MLLAAGMAAGIGAIFRSPMAGAIFAAEILYRGFDLEGDLMIPSMVASTISYMTYASVFGWEPVFHTPEIIFNSPVKFIFFTVLAMLIASSVRFNILFFRQVEIFFRRRRWKPWMKPCVGGLLVGAIGLFFPQILSSGYGVIQLVLTGNEEVLENFGTNCIILLLFLGVLKAVATSFSVGSGGSGGVLGPALFCGAMYGACVGAFFNHYIPDVHLSISNCAMLGMAGYLTAAVRTPLAAILMVSEFTGNHSLLLPAMWVCGLSFMLTPGWTLYKSQLRDRDSSPIHAERHESLAHDVAIRVKQPKNKKKKH